MVPSVLVRAFECYSQNASTKKCSKLNAQTLKNLFFPVTCKKKKKQHEKLRTVSIATDLVTADGCLEIELDAAVLKDCDWSVDILVRQSTTCSLMSCNT